MHTFLCIISFIFKFSSECHSIFLQFVSYFCYFTFPCMSIHLSSSISLSLVHIIFLCSCSSFRTFRYFSLHCMSIHLSFSISLSLVLNIVPCSFSSFSYFHFLKFSLHVYTSII